MVEACGQTARCACARPAMGGDPQGVKAEHGESAVVGGAAGSNGAAHSPLPKPLEPGMVKESLVRSARVAACRHGPSCT
jgi:hypothetical protein